MKAIFGVFFLFPALASAIPPATSPARDLKYRYCDHLADLDAYQDLSATSLEDLKTQKRHGERIVVSKDRRRLYLVSGQDILRSVYVAFGPDMRGPKHFEGDGKTPEGLYTIDFKNEKSDYYLALHVSYPNKADLAYAKDQGKSAGGDIMVHGFPTDPSAAKWVEWGHFFGMNWTQGCMAMTNEEISQVYQLVQEGTPIEICPLTEPLPLPTPTPSPTPMPSPSPGPAPGAGV